MEKKKNNAVEKVEKITDGNKSEEGKKTKKSAYKPENAKKSGYNRSHGSETNKVTDEKTTTVKDTVDRTQDTALTPKEVKIRKKMKKEKAMRGARAERAKQRRKRKDERIALNKQKKAEREKALKAKREVIKKRKAEYKAEKLRRKEERLARRDMLKHESREEREKRIAAEKQAKINERDKKRRQRLQVKEQKASVRRQKLADRRALKEQKRKFKSQNRKEKRSRGIGGWLAAVISLGSVVIVLATLFTLSLMNNFGITPIGGGAANIAETYYDLMDYVGNMDVKMSKLLVSNDAKQQQKLLSELSTEASLAADDISRLPLKDESKYYTTKYINQVADYSKYLNNRLIDGDSLSSDDIENLNSLYKINSQLKEDLSSLTVSMGAEFDFSSIFDESGENMFLEKFNQLESRAVDYPKLIYDGPFSDSLEQSQPKGLGETEISSVTAEEVFVSVFGKYGLTNTAVMGEQSGVIDCYNVSADAEDGEIYASVSKIGGKLIMFNHYMDCTEINYGLDECIEIGQTFLSSLGLDDMTAVWATENGTTAYVNYCYTDGGVICYADMVKVTVCKQRGLVSAYDANAYYLNHTAREISSPTITQKEALTGLSTDLSVLSTRLTLIPYGKDKEVLAYEVYGTFNDEYYYIYVDAASGKEVQIFTVVDTDEGSMLI